MKKPMFAMVILFLGLSLIGIGPEVAQAVTITQVFTPTGLNGPVTLEDFEDGTFVPGVTFSSNAGTPFLISACAAAGCSTPSGTQGLLSASFPDVITMTFAFSSPVASLGMFFGNDDTCCSTGYTAFLDIYGTAGLLGTIGVVANMNDFADQFLGFNSDTLVTQATIRYGSVDVGLYAYIDDLQFSTAAVPEPASVLLLGSGLAGLALWRRKRGA